MYKSLNQCSRTWTGAAARISHAARHAVPKKNHTARVVYEAFEFKRPGRTGAVNPFAALLEAHHRRKSPSMYIWNS